MKGKQYMKHLRINNSKGEFLSGADWKPVSDLTGNDVLALAKAAVEEEDFEMDDFNDAALPNPAHKVIYQKIWTQLDSLHSRKVDFMDETKNIYQAAYDKYCSE